MFSKLVTLHERSDVTSRLRDLGAAYNNTGCLSLMMGDLHQAKCDFEKSLKYLNSAEKRQQLHSSLLEAKLISVKCNIARLHLVSRNFSEAVEMQGQLVKICKDKKIQELPLQVVGTVLNNQAVLHTTLRNFSIAEQELKWLISYCVNMKREDCDFLYNFVALHLSEVLLLHGKSKEAEKAFHFEALTSGRGIDLVGMFGGLHINVRIEAFEKLVDVIVLKGKIKFACELLETGVNILKKSFGPDHFNVASLLYKQGTISKSHW
ncbi:hypothetical protein OS493_035838 [Desmophyllum pertusum]|uniref:Uncharacterized protein n=1 Tax=Desmophyllum pertusum TaxID=174260 RepID=A0A9X0CE78_9CNID|nr:hypothetical protein OS493_035838 [Desmophyllum pertusum]